MASTRMIVLVGLVVLVALLGTGQCQRRRLCRMNRTVGTCNEIYKRNGGPDGAAVGRCEERGGSCELLKNRKRTRCVCAITYDV